VTDKLGDTGERDRWTVNLRHEEAAEDDLVKVGVGSASQESVELDQEGNIWIVAFRSLSVARPLMVCLQIDTHCMYYR